MKVYKLNYDMAIKMQNDFIDLIGKSFSKHLPNAIIERVYIKDYGDNVWVTELFAYDKHNHRGFHRQLVDYLIEENHDFDLEQYGVALHTEN